MVRLIYLVQVARRELKKDSGKIFVAISAGWFLSIGIRMAYPVLLPYFRSDYGLSLTMAGMLLTILWLTYAFGQVPGGILADQFGEGSTMMVSMGVASITLIFIISSSSPLVLYTGTALLGSAISLFGVVRLTALADVYSEKVGTAHGFLGAIGNIGNVLLPPFVGLVATVTFWQLGLGIFLPLFILATILLWIFVPARTSSSNNISESAYTDQVKNVFSELGNKPIIIGTILLIIWQSINNAFVGFFPTYLMEVKNMTSFEASGLFGLFFGVGIITKPIIGNIYDRIGLKQLLIIITIISSTGLTFLPIVNGYISIIAVTVIISILTGGITVTISYVTVMISNHIQNTGLGIIRTIYISFQAISPMMIGVIADHGYFNEAFLLLAALCWSSVIIILFIPYQVNNI